MTEKQRIEGLIEERTRELEGVESKLSKNPSHELYFQRSSLQIRINGLISMLEGFNKKSKKKSKYSYYKINKLPAK